MQRPGDAILNPCGALPREDTHCTASIPMQKEEERLECNMFPNPSTCAFSKMNSRSEVRSGSCHPSYAMTWLGEIESARSVEDLRTSGSIPGDTLLRGRQIAFMIYGYVRISLILWEYHFEETTSKDPIRNGTKFFINEENARRYNAERREPSNARLIYVARRILEQKTKDRNFDARRNDRSAQGAAVKRKGDGKHRSSERKL